MPYERHLPLFDGQNEISRKYNLRRFKTSIQYGFLGDFVGSSEVYSPLLRSSHLPRSRRNLRMEQFLTV